LSVKLNADLPETWNQYWRNDPKIWTWCRQNHEISSKDQRDWAERIHEDPAIEMFGLKVDNNDVGQCGLTSINYHHGTAEFSLLIAPEFQGKGYGSDALIALLDYGFNRLRLETIWGEVLEGNPAMHIFKNIGFTINGTLRSRYFKGRKRLDAHSIDITREEFNEKYER
jgi:diamine N-acetyltransferase